MRERELIERRRGERARLGSSSRVKSHPVELEVSHTRTVRLVNGLSHIQEPLEVCMGSRSAPGLEGIDAPAKEEMKSVSEKEIMAIDEWVGEAEEI